jgi:hypothetical protein
LIFMFKIFSGIFFSFILKTCPYHLTLLFINLPTNVLIYKFCQFFFICFPLSLSLSVSLFFFLYFFKILKMLIFILQKNVAYPSTYCISRLSFVQFCELHSVLVLGKPTSILLDHELKTVGNHWCN